MSATVPPQDIHSVVSPPGTLPNALALLSGTPARALREIDPVIRGVSADSREVVPGSLFLALPGERSHGKQYVSEAVARGACAILSDDEALLASLPDGVLPILAQDVRAAAAQISHYFYGRPTKEMLLLGVTGTNGKTTVAHLLMKILQQRFVAASVGTLGIVRDKETYPLPHTTPFAPHLARIFSQLSQDGYAAATLEVSSHALDQRRADFCEFDGAVFTNLTQDHLDYHRDLESYFQAKQRLFLELPKQSEKTFRAAICVESEYGRRLYESIPGEKVSFGEGGAISLLASSFGEAGSNLTFRTPRGHLDVETSLVGAFNTQNIAAAVALAQLVGFTNSEIALGIAALKSVRGRIQRVPGSSEFSVIVDYAHTPDAVTRVLQALRPLTKGRLICVLGCGGDRDRSKRPLMGNAAASAADVVFITSDNPRSERPDAIIQEILAGIPLSFQGTRYAISDRREAIFSAIKEAQAGDCVAILGKGHENYQILSDRTIAFDDVSVAKEALECLKI